MKIWKIAENTIEKLLNTLRVKYNGIVVLAEEHPQYIYVNDMQVPEDKQNLGIGTEIINEIKRYAKLKNKSVLLFPTTSRENQKILEEFYRRRGFNPIPEKERYNPKSELFSPSAKNWYWK